MKLTAPLLAFCLTLYAAAGAQQAASPKSTFDATLESGPESGTPFTDPANLGGERVAASNGHELPIDEGASGVAQLLRKLNTRASVLLITAHPDDEDGGMLTLYSRGLGARVATLTLNRGEGGQNFVTGDFEDALGLIRTQELLSADRYFDAGQMFGSEVDFGFSKSMQESFEKWDRERVLYDVVRAIRIQRPLVIAAVFIGNVTDGHGQHQVSGEIAQEAFKAAADPHVFPDMIRQGILPWQALKVYARVPWAELKDQQVFDYATHQFVPARFTNYVTGAVTTAKPSADVIVPEGDTDALLTDAAAGVTQGPDESRALSYAQFARMGLALQRTQISGSMRRAGPGRYDSPYHLFGSVLCDAPADARISPQGLLGQSDGDRRASSQRPCVAATAARPPAEANPQSLASVPSDLTAQPDFFSGIDTSIEGIASLAPGAPPFLRQQLARLAEEIQAATAVFDPQRPDTVADPLTRALKTTNALLRMVSSGSMAPEQKVDLVHELRIKRVQINDALVLALGLHLDATAGASNLVEGSSPGIETSLSEGSTLPVTVKQILIAGAEPTQIQSVGIASAEPLRGERPLDNQVQIPGSHLDQITQPYFYRDNIEQSVYQLRNPELRNAAQTPPPLTAWAFVDVQGTQISLGRIVHHGPQPVSIVPPVSIASTPRAMVLPDGQAETQLTATLRTVGPVSANINVESPRNWSIEAKALPASTSANTRSIEFLLHPTAPLKVPALMRVTAQTPDHERYSEGYRSVGYPGLIYTNLYTPATTRVVPVNLKLPRHLRIAYLPGTGDSVPQALASIGLAPTLIHVADLTAAKLASFDTVILGVRAYTAHAELHGAATQALLQFVRGGGNVLVEYQTADFSSADAPYPLSLGNAEKVVVETDPVQLLASSNPLLTTPNKISSADFDHWIEERGHGFLDTWDSHYTALTETHDPGGDGIAQQLPQRGGLVTAEVGKGRWTYCAYALYRQLPEAVPGAFRIFVNLIAPVGR
ncbi:MAG: PIG-L family deacetylase [Acidobacteriaceae bacterium]